LSASTSTILDSRDRRAWLVAALAAAAVVLVAALVGPVSAADAAPRLNAVGNFDAPIYASGAPGDDRRLFVVERGGTIRVMRDGDKLRRPFLRIPGGVSTDGERGLLSMAFHPRYQQNRRFYVFYTTPGDGDLRIDEFRRSAKNPNRALRKSRRTVIRIPHPGFSNHNGGQLQFGSDGLLYISTGDGGGGGDPSNNAQDRSSLLGKLLRVDPTPSGRRAYGVPRSNPFVGKRGRNEIFAYGLRNPHRFSFDRRNGNLTIGDVGQSEVEEVDFRRSDQRSGANFGWSCFEGTDRYKGGDDCIKGSRHVPPVLERRHSQTGDCSITGGYVARHRSLGTLRGRYVYGDFCTGELRSARLDQPRARDDSPLGVDVQDFSLVSFGEGPRGELYVVSIDGRVFRLRA
jgi:hypothetical protein